MKKVMVVFCVFLYTATLCYSKHLYKEAEYQHAYCSSVNGIEEYKLPDSTRVDCLTDTYAIEFDFYNKWAEGIGQALYYGIMTGKKPKVVLILEGNNPESKMKYFERVKLLSTKYNFEVEYITDKIFDECK